MNDSSDRNQLLKIYYLVGAVQVVLALLMGTNTSLGVRQFEFAISGLCLAILIVSTLRYGLNIQPDTSTFDPLPNHFLKLNSASRKEALDLAWQLGLEQIKLLQRTSYLHGGIAGFVATFLLAPCFFLALKHITTSDPGTYWGTGGYLIWTATGIMGSLAVLGYFEGSASQRRAIAIDGINAERISGLKALAISFVGENASSWLRMMELQSMPLATKEAKSHPESRFVLYSAMLSFSPSGMPAKQFGVSYIFTNGYASVVSGVRFDIVQTSYTCVDSDEATPQTNESSSWQIEEFHYRDVVEISFVAGESGGESIKTSAHDYPIDGHLTLTLVNGTQKKYPTTKRDATNFLDVARDKVREAKARS
jgi:hypothetical protein